MRKILVLAGFVILLATTAKADVIYSSNAVFSAQGRSVWSSGPGLSIDTGDRFLGLQWSLGKTFGKVDCFLGACAGAKCLSRISLNQLSRL